MADPSHWTYANLPKGEDDLAQGDILQPSEKLRALFHDVHKHFDDDKYLAFIVASQTCDLARRKGEPEPKAKYIALATVRSLSSVAPGLFESISRSITPGVFPASAKPRALDLLKRIFNQNEQALGLFYLHPDTAVGIGEPAVAFLRVTVSVRAQHYPTLTLARSGRFKEEFRAKLGWLLGNLYARPATPDWSDREGGAAELNRLKEKYVSVLDAEQGPFWIEDAIVDVLKKQSIPLPGGTPEEVVEKLQALRPPTPQDIGLDEIVADLRKTLPSLDAGQLAKVRNSLRNNPNLSRQFRKQP